MKIHVAKAKDLPFSWYELVLRPDKFAEHLQELRKNPEASPSAAHLIVTFLDKAGVYSALSNSTTISPTAFMDVVTGDKEAKLVQCALTMASFLHWDLSHLWNDIPFSVQFCLVSLLRSHYSAPPEVGVVDTEGAVAHAIYSEWVLRFVMQECHAPNTPSRPAVHTWDTTCITTEQIKDMVKAKASESLSYLSGYLDTVWDLAEFPGDWTVPWIYVDLPVLSGEQSEVRLEPFEKGGGAKGAPRFSNRLCEMEYVVGCYLFVEGEYERAHVHLLRAQKLLEEYPQ